MGARLFTQRRPGSDAASGNTASGPVRRGREASALLLFAVSAFLFLALAGLRRDPAVPALTGADWMGPVGAAVAGFMAQGFGLVAWLAPVELLLVAVPMFRGRRDGALSARLAGDLVIAIVLAALVQVAFPELCVFGRLRAGGNVGLLFGELMRGLFSAPGSFLVGGTAVALILVARSSFSFIVCCAKVGRCLGVLAGRVALLVVKLRTAWAEAKRLHRERRETERAAEQPLIDTRPTDEAIIAQLESQDESDWIASAEPEEPPLGLSESVSSGADSGTDALLDAATTPSPAGAGAPPVPLTPPAQTVGSDPGPVAAWLEQACPPPAPAETKAGQAPSRPEATAREGEAPGPARPARPTPGCRREGDDLGNRSARGTPEPGPRIVDTKPGQQVRRSRGEPRTKGRASFRLPPSDLLRAAPPVISDVDKARLYENAALLEKTLADYGVSGKVEEIHPGPTVTTYEVAPAAGTKVSKVASLTDDLALGLSRKVRIIAPIPGKSRIGFEVPNDERNMVYLRDLVEDDRLAKLAKKAPLPVVLGRDIIGKPFYADLASMPHIILAGATGAGKSVGLNVMLSSLLLFRTPEELRLLMIDPKVVELAPYDGIPHMLLPVVTDMKQAATALRWAVDEVDRRYQLFADAGTKNIVTYNRWVERVAAGEIPPPETSDLRALTTDGAVVSVPAAKAGSDGSQLPGKLPYVVVVVDEFADLMMQSGKDVEASVARLAQKARAAGIHVVLATQRPSVDVITGTIKANFPSRIAYRVAQKVDSRTILDEQGAELLLGRGDMLVRTNGSDVRRVQCPFIDEDEVAALTDFLREQGAPQYHDAILADGEDASGVDESDGPADARYDEAVRIVAETQRCSTSWLQRKMTIGYNRAAKIVEMMEKQGVVGPPNGARDREVLVSPL